MNVSINFTVPELTQLLVYLILSLVVVSLITGLTRVRPGLSYIIIVLFAMFGGWAFANLFHSDILPDFKIAGIPLLEAFTGALLFGLMGIVMYGRSGARRYS
jgi:xanthine/uracil permease